ncbi:hypothetical protein Moror_5079, partial [Moniliophthora roreri MCA 2997]
MSLDLKTSRRQISPIRFLLAECHTVYLLTRKALVGPVVREQDRELTRGVELGSAGNMDVVEL